MAGLTEKQKMFVLEYLVDLNATAAALRAGYSDKTAGKIAHQLLEKTRIQEAIQEAMKKRERRTEITSDKVLHQLAKIAFGDIKDFVTFEERRTEYTTDEDSEGNTVKIQKEYSAVRIRPSDEVDGTLLAEVAETKDGLKIKRHDSLKALELIGKHLGMFTEKHEHEIYGKDGGPIQTQVDLSGLTLEELRAIAKADSSTEGGTG